MYVYYYWKLYGVVRYGEMSQLAEKEIQPKKKCYGSPSLLQQVKVFTVFILYTNNAFAIMILFSLVLLFFFVCYPNYSH